MHFNTLTFIFFPVRLNLMRSCKSDSGVDIFEAEGIIYLYFGLMNENMFVYLKMVLLNDYSKANVRLQRI